MFILFLCLLFSLYRFNDSIVEYFNMLSNICSYSNPIYDRIDQSNISFTRPLMIDIAPTCSYLCTNTNRHAPLLLLADNVSSPSVIFHNQHNYVNQRIENIIDDFDEC